jgi:mannose-6-phosphate isomerase
MNISPLKFDPIFCYRIWGGEKLKTLLKKDYKESSIGESWEISAVPGFETRVLEGPNSGKTLRELIEKFKGRLVGNKVYEEFGSEFPLLIKFIDAARPLSIQVHPSDELARERHDSFGKNEMWYIMGADEGAELTIGFNQEIDAEQYERLLQTNEIMKVMNAETVRAGDAFYIPTGRVHAIGAGVLLAEIQQTSDVTYRIYDYDRVDSNIGQKRELHTELAKNAIDFELHDSYRTEYQEDANTANQLIHSPYFKTEILILDRRIKRDLSNRDSFVIYMCVEGDVQLYTKDMVFDLKLGETMLIPAECEEIHLDSKGCRLLEVFL